jgi:hypothetical protein
MKHRGILQKPVLIQADVDGEQADVVIPSGAQVEISSDDSWYHDVSEKDIEDAVALFREADDVVV